MKEYGNRRMTQGEDSGGGGGGGSGDGDGGVNGGGGAGDRTDGSNEAKTNSKLEKRVKKLKLKGKVRHDFVKCKPGGTTQRSTVLPERVRHV